MRDKKTCPACGGKRMKTGKIHDAAHTHSLDLVNGNSDLQVTVCANCGEVISINKTPQQSIDPYQTFDSAHNHKLV